MSANKKIKTSRCIGNRYKIMSNEDFVKLSQKKVKELNGCEDKAAYEAWRDGYNYLNKHLRAILETCYNEKFIYKLEDLCLNGPKKIK